MPARLLLTLAAVCCWLSACGFSKYDLRKWERSEPVADAGAADAMVPVEEPECAVGDYRCDGSALQQCEVGVAGGWKTIQTCDTAERCNAAEQRCEICDPGVGRCDGWELFQCTFDGTDWTKWRSCERAELCNASAVQCDDCLPGDAYCKENALFTCGASRKGYTRQECESADQCNVHSMTCRPCVPGELECNGAQLRRCNDQREWQDLEECESAALCRLGLDGHLAGETDVPGCGEAACEAGATRCDDNLLLGCPPGRDGWQLLDVCASSELCRQANGTQCAEPACELGAMRCDGNELQRCNDDATDWETLKRCGDAELCNTARRDCVACAAGGYQCNDRELQQCSEAGEWQTESTCRSWSACATGEQPGCVEPACAVGAWSCNGAQLELCTMYGRRLQAVCASPELCDANAGRCLRPTCTEPGAVRCAADLVQACAPGLDAWDFVTQCPEGSVCAGQGEACAERCPDHPYRCNDGQPEQCVTRSDGRIEWQLAGPHCATAGLCVVDETGAGCRAPICGGALPEYRCNPDDPSVIEQCAPDRASWLPVATCVAGQICDPGPGGDGPPQCDVCEPDTYSCSSTGDLRRCTSSGQRQVTLQVCGAANRCEVTDDGARGRCIPCVGGETRCHGQELQRCADGEWEVSQLCEAEGCHDVPGDNDYCRVCRAPYEQRCADSNTLRRCSGDQTGWLSSETCAAGCQENGLQDYCRECEPNTAECSDNGRSRRVCSVAGVWQDFERCGNGGSCIDSGSSDYCDVCEPGTANCIGENRRQVCWESGAPGAIEICPDEDPYCLNPGGRCVECLPSAAPACENATTRRVCTATGSWSSAACTGETPACLDGECVACIPGTSQCTGTTLGGRRVCSANGGWQIDNCPGSDSSASVCLAGECVACHPGQNRCTDDGREVCSETGTWEAAECAQGELCVEGKCQDCVDGEARCGDSGREACVGGVWQEEPCPSSEPECVGDGACRCEEQAWRCGDSGRQQCRDGGWADDPCEGGWCSGGECVDCEDDDDCTDENLPFCSNGSCICDEGARRCVAGSGATSSSYEVCEGGSWRAETCAGSTPVCDASSGHCVCAEESERCWVSGEDEAGERQICSDGEWEDQGETCLPCQSDDQCSGTRPLCDGVQCVSCRDIVRACPNQLVCADSGRCVECTADEPGICYGDAPACSASNECVECSSTHSALCVGETPICDDNRCRGCEAGECGEGTVCDTESGACVECREGAGDCGAGLVCEDAACVCADALCPDGSVCANGQCRACAPGDCPAGYACTDGSCLSEASDDD